MSKSFRTEIKVETNKSKIGVDSSILSMGSCFASNVVKHLQTQKINAYQDPLGIAFNPISIAKRITFSLEKKKFSEDQIALQNDIYFHYQAHSDVNSFSISDLQKNLRTSLDKTKQLLTNSDFLILTLGTSFVYEHIESRDIVSNCHKQNPKLFKKRLLDANEIIRSLSKAINRSQEVNPKLNIILTVSPVRHTREGLSYNNLSKSILRIVCHRLSEQFDFVSYFPSYEIMMDDLRSYRFYEDDLIHPNLQSEKYIFNLFEQAFYDLELRNHVKTWQKLLQRINHKPLHPQSSNYKTFLQALLNDLEAYSHSVILKEEITLIKSKIDTFNILES